MGSQLILHFALDPVFTFHTLIVGQGNEAAVTATRHVVGTGQGILTLVGEAGLGKSHLLTAAVDEFRHGGGQAACLEVAPLRSHVEQVTEGMMVRLLQEQADCGLVAVDGLDYLEDSPGLQEILLYLFNERRASGRALIMAGRRFPGEMPGIREDLRSRLGWGTLVPIHPPDDAMLAEIFTKLAVDRQILLAPGVVHYLIMRLPRRIPDYVRIIAQLDQASLEQKRPISIALAKEVLGWP